MFGISLTELIIIGVVALVVVGPQKLPGMLRTLGMWIAKIRRLTTEVREQTGIDDILRAEGLDGGLNELRGLVRGNLSGPRTSRESDPYLDDPYEEVEYDRSREYPVEGADAYGALPDDLLHSDDSDQLDVPEDTDVGHAAQPQRPDAAQREEGAPTASDSDSDQLDVDPEDTDVGHAAQPQRPDAQRKKGAPRA